MLQKLPRKERKELPLRSIPDEKNGPPWYWKVVEIMKYKAVETGTDHRYCCALCAAPRGWDSGVYSRNFVCFRAETCHQLLSQDISEIRTIVDLTTPLGLGLTASPYILQSIQWARNPTKSTMDVATYEWQESLTIPQRIEWTCQPINGRTLLLSCY